MKRFWCGFICFYILIVWSIPVCYAQVKQRKVYRVLHVIDGDTIILDNKEHVRLIGIDTLEMKQGLKFERDLHKRHLDKRSALNMARKSYRFTKNLLENKKVRLEFDVKKYDDYHRLLAYVYLLNGKFVNAEILKAGYAYTDKIKPDIRYASLFNKLYDEARQHHRGLWKKEKRNEKTFKWFNNT